MTIGSYLYEKIFSLLLFVLGLFLFSLFLGIINVNIYFIILFVICVVSYEVISLGYKYYKIKKEYELIISITNELKEKYLLAEVVPKPKQMVNLAYYEALRKANKAMCDRINGMGSEMN